MTYTEMRTLLVGIVNLTNSKRTKQQNGFIRKFNDRRPRHLNFIKVTFQVECLYKTFGESDEEDPYIEEHFNYKSIQPNFILHNFEFYDHHLARSLVVPENMETWHKVIK